MGNVDGTEGQVERREIVKGLVSLSKRDCSLHQVTARGRATTVIRLSSCRVLCVAHVQSVVHASLILSK